MQNISPSKVPRIYSPLLPQADAIFHQIQ